MDLVSDRGAARDCGGQIVDAGKQRTGRAAPAESSAGPAGGIGRLRRAARTFKPEERKMVDPIAAPNSDCAFFRPGAINPDVCAK